MTKIFLPAAVLLSISFAISSCNNETATKKETKSLSLANIDSATKPGNDFYKFANGSWMDTAKIPLTESGIGSGKEMYNRTKEHIKEILESVSKANNTEGSIEQKVGDFYTSGMDSVTIEKAGYTPLKPWLQKINEIKDAKAVLQFAAEQTTYSSGILFGQYFGPDEKNSTTNIAVYVQSGLGLPDRDYYFKTDAATQAVVKAYQTYMQKIFTLTGDDSATAAKNVKAVYELEKQLAGSHRTNVELRDPQSNYNKMAVADLEKKMPVIGWITLLKSLTITTDSVNVSQPAYYQKLNDLLTTVSIDTWKTYLRFHVLNNAAPVLSSDFVKANFEYSGKALSGQQQMKERWERIYRQTDDNLGEALGQLYVKKYFTEEAKKRMLELVNNLQKAFETRIMKLDWMSDSTKTKAKEKLYTFIKKIGYPDKWKDYSKVTIDKNKFFENKLSCGRNEYNFHR